MSVRISGHQEKQLMEALLDAFPTESEIAQMVRYGGITRNLAAVAGSGRLKDVIFNLLVWAGAHDQIAALVLAARNANPTNPYLRAFAEEIDLAATTLAQGELEKIVLKSVAFQNVEQWREKMSACELAVCRVEMPDGSMGTGFLVGPDLVMTNHHVIEKAIHDEGLRQGIAVRFDYKATSDGTTLRSGKPYRLAMGDEWLVDSSPSSDLDYALMRVIDNPGLQPVGDQDGAPVRSWLTPTAHQFEVGEPVFILQHPHALSLKFAAGSITEILVNSNTVRYSANTLRGSSGSPCFNSGWNVVALHHWGFTTHNEGIVISAILNQPKVKAVLSD